MPNERSRHRAARRVVLLPRLRGAPALLLGLVVVAVVGGVTPPIDAPVHWTVRDASGWMAEYDALRRSRGAPVAAAPTTAAPRGDRLAASAPRTSVGVPPAPAEAATGRIVVAQADQMPRHQIKKVPLDVIDPDITGAVPGVKRPAIAPIQVNPTINRSGKGDRLISPTPLGRATERDLFVKPTLATVPPSQDGWPPLMSVASMIAPQSATVLPRLALAAPDASATDGRVVIAMTRTGPGKVVTRSAIAALGERSNDHKSGRPLLPPVPDAQVAAASPRTTVWAQPPVPEMGYARRSADRILARFRAVLGDEPEPEPRALTPDEEAEKMGP